MPLPNILPLQGDHKQEWERMIVGHGNVEAIPDRTKAGQDEAFRQWAAKRHLAMVDGQSPVAFDPKRYNPKDSLDRSRFAFLVKYFRPRPTIRFQRDLGTAFSIPSMYVIEALKNYWSRERIIAEGRERVQADPDMLRLMGFTFPEVMDALDGIVKKEYLAGMIAGYRRMGQEAEEFGQYLVNFGLLKERYFDGEFIVQAAGQPISLSELGEDMGVDSVDDLRTILSEAKKRYDLNIQVSEDHVMFGPPTQSAVDHLSDRERTHKQKLSETETLLRDRQKTIKDLLDRYTAREAKIMNEIEGLREEGRMVYIKGKVVDAVSQKLDGKRG